MEKTELLDSILKDIKELELLVKGMEAMEPIPDVVKKLALVQARNVFDGLSAVGCAGASPIKTQLSHVVDLADAGICVQSIPQDQNSLPNEPKKEETPIPTQVEKAKIEEAPVEKKPEPVAPVVEPEKKAPVVESLPLEEKKSEEKKKEEPSQPIEIEKEPIPVASDKKKNVEPEKEIGTVIASKVVKETQERVITNERFRTGVRSLNETIQVRKPESRFVVSLKKAININDRFRYQRELFSNNASAMNDAVEKLDSMTSLEEAKQFVSGLGWKEENEVVADFMALLEARFSRVD